MVHWNSSLTLCLILAVLVLCIESTTSKDGSTFDNDKSFRRAFARGAKHEPRKISKRQRKPMLQVTTIHDPPFTIAKSEERSIEWSGLVIDLLVKIAAEANFDYNIHLVKDNRYGSFDGTRWNGMVGELVEGKADLAIAALTVTYERERVVDFTTPYLSSGLSFIYASFGQPISPFAFLVAFSPMVWLFFLIAFIVVSFVIFIVAKLSPYEWKHPHHGADVRINRFSLLSSFWFTISGCFRQYSGIAPRSTSVRIIAGTWWLVVLLFILYYVINLIPMLTISKPVNRFESVEDVIKANVKTGFVQGGSTAAFFQHSSYPPYQKIWKQTSKYGSFVRSISQGIKQVQQGGFVFFGEARMLEYYVSRTGCYMKTSPRSLSQKNYAFAVPLNSPYKKTINAALLKLQKNQFIDKLVRKYFPQPKCADDDQAMRSFITMQAMYGIFALLGIGIILGIVVAFLECICKRCCNRNETEPHRNPLADCRSSLTRTRKSNA